MERQLDKARKAAAINYRGVWPKQAKVVLRHEATRGSRREGRIECAVRFAEYLDDLALEMAEMRAKEQAYALDYEWVLGVFDEDLHDRSRLIRETDEALWDDLDRLDSYEYPFDVYEPPWYDM